MLAIIEQLLGPGSAVLVIAPLVLLSSFKILKKYQRAMILRLGRVVVPRRPGSTAERGFEDSGTAIVRSADL